jgi:transcriptional regulator with XRE-family HTH domain
MSSPSLENFAAHLRWLREGRALSQSELAKRADLQPSAIAHFEAGRRTPSANNIIGLAQALDVSTDHLLGFSKRPEVSSSKAKRLLDLLAKMEPDASDLLLEIAAVLVRRHKK